MSWKVYCNTHSKRLGTFTNEPEAEECRREHRRQNPASDCDVSITQTQRWEVHAVVSSNLVRSFRTKKEADEFIKNLNTDQAENKSNVLLIKTK